MKRHGCLYVGLDAENLFDLTLDSDQADKGCPIINGIDQEIEITIFRIVAMQDGPKHARVAGVIPFDD
jgi:hypothetical protein